MLCHRALPLSLGGCRRQTVSDAAITAYCFNGGGNALTYLVKPKYLVKHGYQPIHREQTINLDLVWRMNRLKKPTFTPPGIPVHNDEDFYLAVTYTTTMPLIIIT